MAFFIYFQTMSIQELYEYFLRSEGVNTDSRSLKKGEIFFALKGENFNGNQYAEKAIESGAILAVLDEKEFCKDERYVLVADGLSSLQELAYYHRMKTGIPVIAITGSNGKTTTKELLAAVLSEKYRIHYTRGNLNNHIGVHLSLLQLRNAELAIIEMGANHPGEIAKLCEIADPDFGLITNIGKAHLEGFGSLEGVLRAKTELYKYLAEKKASIFINGTHKSLVEIANSLNLKKYSYFDGENLICDGFVNSESYYLEAVVHFMKGGEMQVKTHLSGNYNLENLLAASAIGKFFNVPENKIKTALENYIPKNNRSQVISTKHNQIILDAYNANPSSMKEAIENFLNIRDDKKIVILGEMAELGDFSEVEHKAILNLLNKSTLKDVFLSGKEFFRFKNDFNFHFFENTQLLYEHLQKNPVKDHFVLLKSSRTGKFEMLQEVL